MYYLVKLWAVCDRQSQCVKALSQYHVIWSIRTVTATTTGEDFQHCHSAEHHSARKIYAHMQTGYAKLLIFLHQYDQAKQKGKVILAGLPSSASDIAVASFAEGIAIAFTNTHSFIRVITVQVPPEPGQTGKPSQHTSLPDLISQQEYSRPH